MNIHASPLRHEARRTGDPAPAPSSLALKYQEDAAGYVAAMIAELRQIAGKAGFDKLVKSLDAAYYDAYGALDAKARAAAQPPTEAGPQKISEPMEQKGS